MSELVSWLNSPVVTVGASGKALLCGGYLVLEHPNIGITIASTSKFYTSVCKLNDNVNATSGSNELVIKVESPQFYTSFEYKYDYILNELTMLGTSRNEFVEKCLLLVLSFCKQYHSADTFKSMMEQIKVNNGVLGIKLRADNDFYSQIKELKRRNLPLLSSSLATLDRFLPCPRDSVTNEVEIAKTGMGSSAALTTSLVGSLLIYLNIAYNDVCDSNESKRIIHNVAQLAHAIAQGKLGSGFDVAAAVYGNQLYRRFNADNFKNVMNNDMSKQADVLYEHVMNQQLWTQTIESMVLPGIDIIMGDVCGGSSSTSMAKEVLKWRTTSPVVATEIWTELAATNESIHSQFQVLNRLYNENKVQYEEHIQWAAGNTVTQWANEGNETVTTLCSLRKLFNKARQLLKKMGDLAGVGIEPDEQTELIDATELLPGVLCAGVPGAGGIDAIFSLTLSPSARLSVETMWSTWGITHTTEVCPLLLHASTDANGIEIANISW